MEDLSERIIKTDEELIAMMQDAVQREQGFRLLIRQYKEQLYYVIRRIVLDHEDADDIFQNTMIKIFRNIDRFEQKSSLYTWMYRIASNEAISFLRSQKRLATLGDSMSEEVSERLLAADPYFDGDEIQKELVKAVAALPEKQREVFQLKYYDDMKYSEMSKLLHTSEGALKASYFHAVRKIESHLNNLNL